MKNPFNSMSEPNFFWSFGVINWKLGLKCAIRQHWRKYRWFLLRDYSPESWEYGLGGGEPGEPGEPGDWTPGQDSPSLQGVSLISLVCIHIHLRIIFNEKSLNEKYTECPFYMMKIGKNFWDFRKVMSPNAEDIFSISCIKPHCRSLRGWDNPS